MSIAAKADYVRRLFVRYQVLVDFEGDAPATLAQRLDETSAARETLGQFSRRVLKRELDQVMFFQGMRLPAQTQIASVKVNAPGNALSQALKRVAGEQPAVATPTLSNERMLKKLERRANRLDTELGEAKAETAALRKRLQGQTYSRRSVDALVEELNAYLYSKAPVDELVANRVKEVVTALESGGKLSDALWPLVVMADESLKLKRKAEHDLSVLRDEAARGIG